MRHLPALLLACRVCAVPLSPAAAQSVQHMVRGTVFDSVTHVALARAVVQAVQLDSGQRPTTHSFWSVTDSRGRFTIADMPAGRFAIGFQHDALTALNLESPVRVIELGSELDITVNLGIPAGSVVRAASCVSAHAAPYDGMIAGYVRDASGQAIVDSADVELHWVEVALTGGTYRTVPHRVIATINEGGAYSACGVAGDSPVSIRVARKGYHTMDGEIAILNGGTVRRDFRLASVQTARGTATLVGRVIRADSTALGAGHVLVPALGLDVDVENGGFTVSRLPPGTWTIVVKAIGYEPQSAMVDLVANATVSTVVVIGEKVQMLGAISVLGTPSAEYRKLAEILERKSVGFGTFFMPGDERITRALGLTDLVRTAAGFDIHGMGRVIGGSKGLNRCRPTLFVDGMRDAPMVPMREVLAVAAYPDVAGTPVNWRDGRMCAAIAVWTKR